MKGLFRFASFVAVLLAFVLVIADGTTMISGKAFTYTTMGEFIAQFQSPGALDRLQQSISRNLHPAAWGLFNLVVLAPPAVINLSILSLVAWMIGRRREEKFSLAGGL